VDILKAQTGPHLVGRMHSLGCVRERRGQRLRSGLDRFTSNTASVE